MAGTRAERGRCWDYLTWLLKQRRGSRFTVPDLEKRDDCTELRIPRGAAGRVQGAGGATLRSIERETKTFCFLTPDRDDPDGKEELVLIFGVDKKRRYRALDLIEDAMSGRYRAREREDERGGRRRDGSRDRRGRDRDRERDRDRDRDDALALALARPRPRRPRPGRTEAGRSAGRPAVREREAPRPFARSRARARRRARPLAPARRPLAEPGFAEKKLAAAAETG